MHHEAVEDGKVITGHGLFFLALLFYSFVGVMSIIHYINLIRLIN